MSVRRHVGMLCPWSLECHAHGVPQQWSECWLLPEDSETVLLALHFNEPLLFIVTPRLLCGKLYLWCVRVVTYERPTTNHIRRIRQVVEAPAPRWMFEAGMREASREALVVL
jgi:hypothetical protein